VDTFKKAMYFGLGALSLTKEKAETIADDLVKRGEMKEKDRGKMVKKLLQEGETQKRLVEEQVSTVIQKTMVDMGFPSQTDFKNILRRLEGIEKAINTPNSGKEGTKA
jgi:polyhydroxyalkanoate synthesis regulator phasin